MTLVSTPETYFGNQQPTVPEKSTVELFEIAEHIDEACAEDLEDTPRGRAACQELCKERLCCFEDVGSEYVPLCLFCVWRASWTERPRSSALSTLYFFTAEHQAKCGRKSVACRERCFVRVVLRSPRRAANSNAGRASFGHSSRGACCEDT